MRIPLLILGLFAVTLIFQSCRTTTEAEADPLNPSGTSGAIYLGPVVGYNRALHSVNLASFSEDVARCPSFTNGSQNGFFFGGSFEYPFAKVNSRHSIIARVLYNRLPAYLEETGDNFPSLVPHVNGTDTTYETVMSSTQHEMDVKYDLLTFEAMYKFNVISTFGVTIGPTFDFALTKTFDQRYKLISPDNVQFVKDLDRPHLRYVDDDRTIIVKEGDITNSSSFRLGLKLGVQYEFLMGGKYYIVPGFFYNLGITDLSSDQDWKVNAIQAGVDIRFAL